MPTENMLSLIGIFLASAGCSWLATKLLISVLRRLGAVDRPNKRSSHTKATVTGAGLAVVGCFVVLWVGIEVLSFSEWSPDVLLVAGLTIGLMLVSLIDDLRPLSPVLRLACHMGVVGIALWGMPALLGVFSALPLSISGILVFLGWVWFINLYNFMDGVDGLCGAETIAISVGIIAITLFFSSASEFLLPAVLLTGVSIGFLFHNWSPARIFMGDVGSVPIGFLVGWMLLSVSERGYLLPAIILASYYLADATLTLFKRIARGERFWHPHREHFYQRAVQDGLSHSRTVLTITAANTLFIFFALATTGTLKPLVISLWILTLCIVLWYLVKPISRWR